MAPAGDHIKFIKLMGEGWDIDQGNGTIYNRTVAIARYSQHSRTWEKTDGWSTVERPSWQEFMKDIDIALRD